jgi:4a-hydroxytetrahydrobiopterin dehydratase
MVSLGDDEARERMRAVPGWELHGGEIRRQYGFADFKAAIVFVNRVAELAEAMNHHPDILINYSRVTLVLTSHDSGGLTERDFRLAAKIDA